MKTVRKRRSETIKSILATMSEDEIRRTDDRMSLADKIAELLALKGLTQKAFAKKVHRTESEVSEWLSGSRNFTIDTLSDIGAALGVNFFSFPPRANRIPNELPPIKKRKDGALQTYLARSSFGPVGACTTIGEETAQTVLTM